MAIIVRSLTDVFILMRNNALRSKYIFTEQGLDDRVALVSPSDLEKCVSSTKERYSPLWMDDVEEVQYEMTKIRQKFQELTVLHDKHLTRPTMDDMTLEEKDIEMLTQDITKMFLHCQSLIHHIRAKSKDACPRDIQVSRNVLTCLVTSLQELSTTFRSSQSAYLRKLRSREERSQQFFDTPLLPAGNGSISNSNSDDCFDQKFISRLSQEQQQLIEDNSQIVEQREREITQTVRSILELNEIFKDLAAMVADQGTVLDRIDYNLEQVQTKVHEGLQQLQKAEGYQRKNHKMMFILVLATTSIMLIITLIIVKS